MDDKELRRFFDEAFGDEKNLSRKILERVWFRNILYYIGEQYIEWVVSINSFRRKPSHPFTPTPVANIIRDYIIAMKALFLNKEFVVRIWPNSNEQIDRDAALLGERVLGWMDEMNDGEFIDEMEKTCTWMLLTGIGLNRTYPDMDEGKKGGFTAGDVASKNVIPFNFICDEFGENLRTKRYVGMKSLQDKEWVEDTFKVKLKKDEDNPNIINYEKRLMKLVGQVSPWKTSGIETSLLDMRDEKLVIMKELEFKPTKKYPKGRYAIMASDELLLNIKELPIPVDKDGSWDYTFTDFHYHHVPGRFWSDSGVNDLISPQNSINSIDQALEVNRKGLGRPLITTPVGMTLKRLNEYGVGFLMLQYDALLSGGQPPKIDRGTPLPQEILLERTLHKETVQDSAGDPKHVLRGKPASSRSSGIQVDILRDAAESLHQQDITRFYRSRKRVYKKRLILAREIYKETRILKIAGPDNIIRIKNFKGADLRNNTDVRLEISSNIASTQAGRTQLLIQMAQTPMLGNLENDPEMKHELMKRVGLGGVRTKNSVHAERAERENAMVLAKNFDGLFISLPNPETGEMEVASNDPFFKYDDHFVHYEVHVKFMLSGEFYSLPKEVQGAMMAHTDIHHLMMKAVMSTLPPLQPGEPGVGGQPVVDKTASAAPGNAGSSV